MKKKKLSAWVRPEPKTVEANSLIETITRFWVTIFIIAAILYLAIMVISRTEGFRDLVRQRLEIMSGMTLEVEQVRATLNLNLILEGVKEKPAETNRLSGLTVQRADLHWRLLPLIRGEGWPFKRLKMENVELRFTQARDGTWSPLSSLNDALAPWVEIATTNTTETGNVLHITDYLREEKAEVEITNLRIAWMGPEEATPPLALVEGLNFQSAAIRPFNENLMWFIMKIQHGERNQVVWANGVNIEWIRMPDQDVILKLTGDIKPLSQLSSLYTPTTK